MISFDPNKHYFDNIHIQQSINLLCSIFEVVVILEVKVILLIDIFEARLILAHESIFESVDKL